MPRVLSRLPYGAKSEPVEEFAFEEETDGHTGEKYAWMNAAYAMAANINRAFKEYGWCARIRGVQSGGEVINLPTHTFPTDDGGVDLKCPTEIAISDRREAELAKSGLIPLDPSQEHRQGGLHRRAVALQAEEPIRTTGAGDGVRATCRRGCPTCSRCRRFAHYLKCMVRDKVGSYEGEASSCSAGCRTGSANMSTAIPINSSEETKATRPLAGAAIEIVENEENPGYYSATFELRPHFQLEGMDIGLSLVSRLPAPAN